MRKISRSISNGLNMKRRSQSSSAKKSYSLIKPRMRDQDPLVFGGGDKTKSVNDIERSVLLPQFTLNDWNQVGSLTRFFIFLFRQGSGPSNPDLVTFSWKISSLSFQPYISVVSTEKILLNPQIAMTSNP